MQALYDKMSELVASPALAFFTSNTDDFLVHDRREIVEWGTPQAQWLWVVHSSGTSLTRLHVCPLEREWAEASLNRGYSPQKFFHLTVDGPREILRAQALALLAKPFTYELAGHELWSMVNVPTHIATASLAPSNDDAPGSRSFDVSFTTHRTPSQEDICVMRLASIRLAVKSTQSLFTRVGGILIDGVPLVDALEHARQRERHGESGAWLNGSGPRRAAPYRGIETCAA